MICLFLSIIGYLFGACNSAIIVCYILKLGLPNKLGSCNSGATNVLRIGNKKAAILTLFFDIIKGYMISNIALYYKASMSSLSCIAFFTIIGHIFPVFFNFRGGKGVSITLGVLLSCYFHVGIYFIVTWFLFIYITRYASLSSICAVLFTAILMIVLFEFDDIKFLLIIFLIIIINHYKNIKRLFMKTENRIF